MNKDLFISLALLYVGIKDAVEVTIRGERVKLTISVTANNLFEHSGQISLYLLYTEYDKLNPILCLRPINDITDQEFRDLSSEVVKKNLKNKEIIRKEDYIDISLIDDFGVFLRLDFKSLSVIRLNWAGVIFNIEYSHILYDFLRSIKIATPYKDICIGEQLISNVVKLVK